VVQKSRQPRKPLASETAPATAPVEVRLRRRMLASEREELILDQATHYFAEFGLSAGTIELARRIGITQPLLYKYFPTKEALLVRVYDRLFPQNWSPALETAMEDETRPVRERLTLFYQQFTRTVLTYEHVRLFLFSGLTNSALNARYYTILTERIFTRIIAALRTEYLDGAPEGPPGEAEMELVQSLHAAIYHIAFRRWLHGLTVEEDLDSLVARKVDFYLDGAAASLKALNAPPTKLKAVKATKMSRKPAPSASA